MKSRIRSILSIYMPSVPYVYVYMLQQVEYEPKQFIEWLKRGPDYSNVIKRKSLELTKKAKSILFMSYATWISLLILSLILLINGLYLTAGLLILITPILVALVLFIVIRLSHKLLSRYRLPQIEKARNKLSEIKAKKIVVVGSYGKTTMKEILSSVLSESHKVISTPGNMNVMISHARWINSKIVGDEDIIIFEIGEYMPGDVASMAELIKPDYAVITGFAPNHLDNYKSVEELKSDLLSVTKFVDKRNIFISSQANMDLKPDVPAKNIYSPEGVLGWKVESVKSSIEGLILIISKGKDKIRITSKLVGKHLIPTLSLVASFSSLLGTDTESIELGLSKTEPFAHRLQPYELNGAWIIDDTYNGNLEGIRAGLILLKELSAKRKIYVTPGLVEQGDQKEYVHKTMASLIKDAKPDEVILMKNSSTSIIYEDLANSKYEGKIKLVDDPLSFYSNLQHYIASGDVVLMQNDWTDNYN